VRDSVAAGSGRSRPFSRLPAVLAAVVVCGVLPAAVVLAASNTVPSSKAGRLVQTITPAALEPSFCTTHGITATTLVTGATATVTGTSGADLLIGRGGLAQNLVGNGGNDCIVAGGVPAGKTTTLSPSVGTQSACVKGPGPGTYSYGAGCAFKG